MTSQEHIDAIGKAIVQTEEAVDAMRRALNQTERSLARLHARMDAAQRAYQEAYPADNVVLFSGGSNKPEPPQ